MREVVVVLGPILRVLFIVFDIIIWTVFVWVILSWILFFASQTSFRWRNRGIYNVLEQLNDIFTRMTWPFLRPFRAILPTFGGFDFSPIIAFFVLRIISAIVVNLIRG